MGAPLGSGSPTSAHCELLLGLCRACWDEDPGGRLGGNGVPQTGSKGSFRATRAAFRSTVCGPRGRSGQRAPPNNGPPRIVLPAAARRSAASKGPRATRHRRGRGDRGLGPGARATHKGWPSGNLSTFASTGWKPHGCAPPRAVLPGDRPDSARQRRVPEVRAAAAAQALGGTRPVTATQAWGRASDARASPSHSACNRRHGDLGGSFAGPLPQRCPPSAPTSPQSRQSLVTTRGSQDAHCPHHPQPSPLPGPGRAQVAPSPQSRTLRTYGPGPTPSPSSRRPRANCTRGQSWDRLPGPKPRPAGLRP